ncbi:MAG: hypothetical protein J0L93_08995 [Deltaproteobacteria bacterium]|nr:hypothetical protein [Deltaproteobacteria bacterium]
MKNQNQKSLIERPQLKEDCPCNSTKSFGACCGQEELCDCKSHKSAGECCYKDENAGKELLKKK